MWLKDCENKCEIKILVYKSGHKFLQPAISICSVAAKVASTSSCSNSKQQFAEIQASCSCSRLIAAAAAQLHEQCYTGPTNFCCSTKQHKQQLYINSHKSSSFLIIYDPCTMLICCSNKIITRIHHHPCGQTTFTSWCNFQHCQITSYSSIDYSICPSKPDEGMFMNSWTFGIFLLVVYFGFVFFKTKNSCLLFFSFLFCF